MSWFGFEGLDRLRRVLNPSLPSKRIEGLGLPKVL